MGKHKIHDWQYKSKTQTRGNNALDLALNPYRLGIQSAVYLANAELKEKKEAMRILAADKVAKEKVDELSNAYTDWDLGCMALVLHRKYGKSAEEVVEFLTDVQNLTRDFVQEGVNSDQIWDIVRDEVGLDITREY